MMYFITQEEHNFFVQEACRKCFTASVTPRRREDSFIKETANIVAAEISKKEFSKG